MHAKNTWCQLSDHSV